MTSRSGIAQFVLHLVTALIPACQFWNGFRKFSTIIIFLVAQKKSTPRPEQAHKEKTLKLVATDIALIAKKRAELLANGPRA